MVHFLPENTKQPLGYLEYLVAGRGDGTVGRLGDNLGLHPVRILLVDHLGIERLDVI